MFVIADLHGKYICAKRVYFSILIHTMNKTNDVQPVGLMHGSSRPDEERNEKHSIHLGYHAGKP